MSIASEIERLKNAKTSIASAIEEKGVAVPAETSIDEYGNYVSLIPSGDYATKEELEALSNTANADTRVEYVDNVLKTLGGTEIVTGNARIATGSYVGTGVYGANNPTSITFEFEPKLVFVHGLEEYQTGFINASACTTNFVKGTFRNFGKTNVQYAKKSNDGKTIYFYDTGDQWLQHNGANITYYFIAIG